MNRIRQFAETEGDPLFEGLTHLMETPLNQEDRLSAALKRLQLLRSQPLVSPDKVGFPYVIRATMPQLSCAPVREETRLEPWAPKAWPPDFDALCEAFARVECHDFRVVTLLYHPENVSSVVFANEEDKLENDNFLWGAAVYITEQIGAGELHLIGRRRSAWLLQSVLRED